MSVCRVLAAAALLLLLPWVASAQFPASQHSQVQLQYHELVPAGADSTTILFKIFGRIRHDCEVIGKAFGRKCVINNINIYTNTNYSGEMAGTRMINATASVMLPAEAAASRPSSTSPSSAGPLPGK
jgi:hypothetical protein